MKIVNRERFVTFIVILIIGVLAFYLGKLANKPKCFTQPQQLNQQIEVEKLYVTTYTFSSDVPVCE